jgi:hypothetical protein
LGLLLEKIRRYWQCWLVGCNKGIILVDLKFVLLSLLCKWLNGQAHLHHFCSNLFQRCSQTCWPWDEFWLFGTMQEISIFHWFCYIRDRLFILQQYVNILANDQGRFLSFLPLFQWREHSRKAHSLARVFSELVFVGLYHFWDSKAFFK